MNILQGHIEQVKTSGSLTLAHIRVAGILLTAVVIDTPETAAYLVETNPVQVIFKETEVVIGRGVIKGVSLRNRLPGKVHAIDRGGLLSKVSIATEAGLIASIITTTAVDELGLEPGLDVTALIKTNELMLAE